MQGAEKWDSMIDARREELETRERYRDQREKLLFSL